LSEFSPAPKAGHFHWAGEGSGRRRLSSVALGCCLHFAFLWAVLHLLSHILGRMERRGESESQ